MELVISDTNIFIDVISLGMADVLFQLPYYYANERLMDLLSSVGVPENAKSGT